MKKVFLCTKCIGERPWFGKIKHKWMVRLHSQNFGNELREARTDSEWQNLVVYRQTAPWRVVVVKSGQRQRKTVL